jgi:hypothetical protein
MNICSALIYLQIWARELLLTAPAQDPHQQVSTLDLSTCCALFESSNCKIKSLRPNIPQTDVWTLESLSTNARNQHCAKPDWMEHEAKGKI